MVPGKSGTCPAPFFQFRSWSRNCPRQSLNLADEKRKIQDMPRAFNKRSRVDSNCFASGQHHLEYLFDGLATSAGFSGTILFQLFYRPPNLASPLSRTFQLIYFMVCFGNWHGGYPKENHMGFPPWGSPIGNRHATTQVLVVGSTLSEAPPWHLVSPTTRAYQLDVHVCITHTSLLFTICSVVCVCVLLVIICAVWWMCFFLRALICSISDTMYLPLFYHLPNSRVYHFFTIFFFAILEKVAFTIFLPFVYHFPKNHAYRGGNLITLTPKI